LPGFYPVIETWIALIENKMTPVKELI